MPPPPYGWVVQLSRFIYTPRGNSSTIDPYNALRDFQEVWFKPFQVTHLKASSWAMNPDLGPASHSDLRFKIMNLQAGDSTVQCGKTWGGVPDYRWIEATRSLSCDAGSLMEFDIAPNGGVLQTLPVGLADFNITVHHTLPIIFDHPSRRKTVSDILLKAGTTYQPSGFNVTVTATGQISSAEMDWHADYACEKKRWYACPWDSGNRTLHLPIVNVTVNAGVVWSWPSSGGGNLTGN